MNTEKTPFVVIVKFETTAKSQETALSAIKVYISNFLSQQPGFISATLHRSFDGLSIANYTHWESAYDFKNFAKLAKDHPDLPKLIQYNPSPCFYEITEQF
ncbi:hypothetical protein A9Q81_04675 [Gammaproteobacteria bacterium 42_54_T18]|nr:hypothetical protein A9Q81_04675 [Gammaproteobacteria bacterium 42_54_T18]